MNLPKIVFLDIEQGKLAEQQMFAAGAPHRVFEFHPSVQLPADITMPISKSVARRIERSTENQARDIGAIVITNGRGAGLITADRAVPEEMRHLVVVVSHDEISSDLRRSYSNIGVVNFVRKYRKTEEPEIITIKDFCKEFANGLNLENCTPVSVIQRIKSGRLEQKDMAA